MLRRAVRYCGFLVLYLGVFHCYSLKSQNQDAQVWTSVNLEAKIVKKLTANVAQEVRFNENVTEVGTIYTDLGLEYKLNKHFQVSINYRFVEKRRTDDYYSFRQRIYIDLKYDEKIKPFQIQFRSRIQDEVSDIERAADGGIPEYYLRNKLTLKLDKWKKLTPFVSVELFSPLEDEYKGLFDNIRSSAGIDYDLSKHHKVELFYMIQQELNVSQPETDFVLGVGYGFKL
jgi:hypothetical protein